MDTLKGEIGRGQVRFRVGRGHFRLEASNQIRNHQGEMIFHLNHKANNWFPVQH